MDVALQNKQAFKDVLANYAPSEHAMELLAGMPLVILQGISGSGRNTQTATESNRLNQLLY